MACRPSGSWFCSSAVGQEEHEVAMTPHAVRVLTTPVPATPSPRRVEGSVATLLVPASELVPRFGSARRSTPQRSESISPNLAAVDALAAAVDGARVVEASRTLAQLEQTGYAPEDAIGAEAVIDVRTACRRFEDSQGDFLWDEREGWVVERLGNDLEVGLRLEPGRLRMACTVEFRGCSSMRVLAALCEGDLWPRFRPSVLHAEPLGSQSMIKSAWHLRQQSSVGGSPEDAVAEVTVVDALEEPQGCLWVSVDEFPMAAPNSYSCCSGQASASSRRRAPDEPHQRISFRIKPVRRPGLPEGCELSVAASCRAPSVAVTMLSLLPAFALRAAMTARGQDLVVSLRRHTVGCRELERRIQCSPRADLYEEVQKRLAGPPRDSLVSLINDDADCGHVSADEGDLRAGEGADKTSTPSTMTPAVSFTESSAMCSEAEDAEDSSLSGADFSFCDCRLSSLSVDPYSWEEFSKDIPLCWAD